jgi:hypothetical protein
MTRLPEDKKEYQIVEFVEPRNLELGTPDKFSEIPTSCLRLTQFGREIALKLGEGSKKLTILYLCYFNSPIYRQPEPNQRILEDQILHYPVEPIPQILLSSHTFLEFPDLKDMYDRTELFVRSTLSDVAAMRKFIEAQHRKPDDMQKAVLVLRNFGDHANGAPELTLVNPLEMLPPPNQ